MTDAEVRSAEELKRMRDNWATSLAVLREGGVEDGFATGWVLALTWALNEPVIIN